MTTAVERLAKKLAENVPNEVLRKAWIAGTKAYRRHFKKDPKWRTPEELWNEEHDGKLDAMIVATSIILRACTLALRAEKGRPMTTHSESLEKIFGIKGLKRVDPRDLVRYEKAMRKAIPQMLKEVRRRQKLAAEARRRFMGG